MSNENVCTRILHFDGAICFWNFKQFSDDIIIFIIYGLCHVTAGNGKCQPLKSLKF